MLIDLRWKSEMRGLRLFASEHERVVSAIVVSRGGQRVFRRQDKETYRLAGPSGKQATRFWASLAILLKSVKSLESWEFRDEPAQPKEGGA